MDELKKYHEKTLELIGENYKSPKIDLFRTRLKNFLKSNYSDDYAKIIDSYFRISVVTSSTDFQELHIRAMERVAGFLEDIIESGDTPKSTMTQKSIVQDELSYLHPKILAASQKLYKDEHYREAVGKAFMVVKDRLRSITGFENAYPAFEEGGLYISGAAAINVDPDFQEAVKRLLGAIDKFRNEKSHTAEGTIDEKVKALSYLYLCNLAIGFLETDQYIIKRS